jgi:hypothetical protein
MDQSFCSPLQISEEMIAKVAGDDKVSNLKALNKNPKRVHLS